MVDRIQYCYYRDDFIETTKSNLDKIYNFWIEAFDGFEGVSFEMEKVLNAMPEAQGQNVKAGRILEINQK